MTEYFDRLPWDKIGKLREIAGGELNWGRTVHRLPAEKKAEFGRVVFGCEVKNLRIENELNVSTGYHIPIIIAEAAR